MAGVTVADSLRSMVNLAKDANVEELHLEKARLETRLDAVNRLLEGREKIAMLMEAANAGPAVPVQPATHYAPPAVRVPPSAHVQHSVDANDPPPRSNSGYEDEQTHETRRTMGVDVDADSAVQRTLEYLKLPPAKRASAFANNLARMVRRCGELEKTVGYASPTDFAGVVGMAAGSLKVFLTDPRIKLRIERVGRGQYCLTEEGRGLYKALTTASGDGDGCA